MIERYTGEHIKIEREVLNLEGLPANLTGATAKFSLKSRFGGVATLKTCTISENVLSVTLTPTDTAIEGTYDYEFKLKLNNEFGVIDRGELILIGSDIPSTF